LGDEEVIKLDKTYKAQYVRFSGFEKAQKALSQVTDVRIYGTEMDYIGVCDITGNINVEKVTEEESFTDFTDTPDSEFSNDEISGEEDESKHTYKKKVIRRKFIPGDLDWWVILIIVVASVLVLAGAGITIFIVIRKKRAKSEKQ